MIGPLCPNAECKVDVSDDVEAYKPRCPRCQTALEPAVEIRAENKPGIMSAANSDVLWPLRKAAYRDAQAAMRRGELTEHGYHPGARVHWEFGNFLAIGGYPVGPKGSIVPLFSGFQATGTNNSDEPITKVSGYLRSNLTNERFPLCIIVSGKPVLAENTNGIPPRAPFGIFIPFGPDPSPSREMLNEETFLRKFGDFTVVIELDGRIVEHHVSSETILRSIANWKRGVYRSDRPGVSKKAP